MDETTVISDLADLIHDESCGRVRPCGYGHPDNSHHQYYHDRARALYDRLEPDIGAANVLHVTRVVIDEIW